MFKIEVVRKNASVTIKDETGKTMYNLKSGASVTMSDTEMGFAAKCVQGLLSIKPPLILVNKVKDGAGVSPKKSVNKENQKESTKKADSPRQRVARSKT